MQHEDRLLGRWVLGAERQAGVSHQLHVGRTLIRVAQVGQVAVRQPRSQGAAEFFQCVADRPAGRQPAVEPFGQQLGLRVIDSLACGDDRTHAGLAHQRGRDVQRLARVEHDQAGRRAAAVAAQRFHQAGGGQQRLATEVVFEPDPVRTAVAGEVHHLVARIAQGERIAQPFGSGRRKAHHCPCGGRSRDRVRSRNRTTQPLPFAPHVQRRAVGRAAACEVGCRCSDHCQHAQMMLCPRIAQKIGRRKSDHVAAARNDHTAQDILRGHTAWR